MLPGFAIMDRRFRSLKAPPRSIRSETPAVSPTSVVDAATQPPEDSEWEEENAPRGHAVDVLQLLDRSWFGEGPKLWQRSARTLAPPSSSTDSSPRMKAAAPAAAPTPLPLPPSSDGPFDQLAVPAAVPPPVPTSVRPQPQPSLPIPASAPKQQQPPEALAVQLLPGIGTWAGRQRLFARPVNLADLPRSTSNGSLGPLDPMPSPAGAAAATQLPGTPTAGVDAGTAASGSPAPLSGRSSVVREEQAREAAWRWRFSRKWEAEQKKYYEEGGARNGSVVSNDALDAIQYTQACGIGVDLQFAPHLQRTTSRQSDLTMHHSLSCQFDVSGHGGSQALSALASEAAAQDRAGEGGAQVLPRRSGGVAPWLSPGGGLEAGQASATSTVLGMVNKARDLLQQQKKIEEEAQNRWERSMNGGDDEAWAGKRLRAVIISMTGRFRYVVLRAMDARGRQKYVVRGRTGCTPAELVEEVAQEVTSLGRREGVPQLILEQVGVGVMEWREDTDRHLHISAAHNSGDALLGAASSGGGSHSPTKRGGALSDVSALAASLVRQVLPCHFQISTTSGPSRLATLMDTLDTLHM